MAIQIEKLFQTRFAMEFREFFSISLKLLDWIGLSLDEKVNYRYFLTNLSVSILFFFSICLTSMDTRLDYELRFEALAMLVTEFDILLKTFCLFWNIEMIATLYRNLENMFDSKGKDQQKVIKSWKFVKSWIVTSIVSILMIVITPFFITLYVLLVKKEFVGLLPILRNFPNNEYTYVPILLSIIFSVLSVTNVMLANDSMTILILAHISHQFRQVAEGFKNYSGGKEALKELVDRHCVVFELVFPYFVLSNNIQ